MKKRIWTTCLMLSLVLVVPGCADSSIVNKKVLEKGEGIWLNHRDELKQIVPICDELFASNCIVYYILTSPTTDLYAQGVWQDNLYYDGCIVEPSQTQVDKVISLIPRPDVNDIYYLKGVFTSFGLSYMSKEDDALLLVYIEDIDTFNKVYNLTQYDRKDDNKVTNGWMKALDDHWYVCSANLIHDGSRKVCEMLNK